ncbi:hypothetical protein ACFY96_28010 [Streptomyces massasporeus]
MTTECDGTEVPPRGCHLCPGRAREAQATEGRLGPLLRPLPREAFETGRWFTPTGKLLRPGHRRLISYSVPDRFTGRQLRVLLHAYGLVVSDGRTVVAHHERVSGRGEPPGPGPPSGDLQLDA